MDVTLIDAFKIKEINLLIVSYIFAVCHDLFILKSDKFARADTTKVKVFYNVGSVIGGMTSGILIDLVFKKKRFLSIMLLAFATLCFDMYLFFTDFEKDEEPNWFFMMCLGAILNASNIIYLFLLPMLIAK